MKNQKGVFPPIVGIVIIVVVAIAFGGVFAYQYLATPKANNQQQNLTACTQEAKLCPDGSSVSRTGPNCEFAECPGQTLSLVYSNDKKYSAFIETIEEPNLVISKIHVKNQQTNEDKIIKTESCCINGSGCGLCPLPCQIKNFSPSNKYVLIDCGTSPQRTVKVINIDTKKEISFSSGSGYSWLNNEEIKFTDIKNYEFDGSIIDCRINVNSGIKTCDTQSAGWKTYTNTQYGFEFKPEFMDNKKLTKRMPISSM